MDGCHAIDRYFDFPRDLSPGEAAALLHGDLVWQARRHGEWVALLRFPRSNEAWNGLGERDPLLAMRLR